MLNSTQLAQKFDMEWSYVTKLAAAHPKTTIIGCLIVGILLGHFI